MAMKSSLVLFRSLAASPMKSCCCCSRFLSSSSKEKSPAYHRGEDDEPSIRSRLPPREKGKSFCSKVSQKPLLMSNSFRDPVARPGTCMNSLLRISGIPSTMYLTLSFIH
ncbi:hypothetical protein MKW94_001978 [Papaver nudicaule]|uniref:Uncharacterized protein n=1 Tax=Papaver nudicaule TaxID=74823 RepID=A0AA41VE09_PAPNU|nr:hypothetical protein [Papaver nudicaule]